MKMKGPKEYSIKQKLVEGAKGIRNYLGLLAIGTLLWSPFIVLEGCHQYQEKTREIEKYSLPKDELIEKILEAGDQSNDGKLSSSELEQALEKIRTQ